MTLTQEQVIEAVTKLNSDIERYFTKSATFLVFGFVSGFFFGLVMVLMWH